MTEIQSQTMTHKMPPQEQTPPKKRMNGSEVRKAFLEAQRRRLANPLVMTTEKVRQNQSTMKSGKDCQNEP